MYECFAFLLILLNIYEISRIKQLFIIKLVYSIKIAGCPGIANPDLFFGSYFEFSSSAYTDIFVLKRFSKYIFALLINSISSESLAILIRFFLYWYISQAFFSAFLTLHNSKPILTYSVFIHTNMSVDIPVDIHHIRTWNNYYNAFQ